MSRSNSNRNRNLDPNTIPSSFRPTLSPLHLRMHEEDSEDIIIRARSPISPLRVLSPPSRARPPIRPPPTRAPPSPPRSLRLYPRSITPPMRAPFPTREMLEMDDRARGDLPPRPRYEITGSARPPQRPQERNDAPPPYSHNDALGQLPVMPVFPVLPSGIQAHSVRAGPSRPDTLSPPPYPVLSQLERGIRDAYSFFDRAYDPVVRSELRLKVQVAELEAKVIEMQARIDTHDVQQRVRARSLEVAEAGRLQAEEGRVAAEAKLRTLEARRCAAGSGLCESCQKGRESPVELTLNNEFQRRAELSTNRNMLPWAAELNEILGIDVVDGPPSPMETSEAGPSRQASSDERA